MVGIFQKESGRPFIAAASDKETAIKLIHSWHDPQYETKDSVFWWEYNLRQHNGAPMCYEIKDIDFYGEIVELDKQTKEVGRQAYEIIEEDERYVVNLTPDQIRLLNWLCDNCLLLDIVSFEPFEEKTPVDI